MLGREGGIDREGRKIGGRRLPYWPGSRGRVVEMVEREEGGFGGI